MEYFFTVVSILLTLVGQSHVTATGPCSSYQAEKKPGRALVGHVINTVSLEGIECMRACNNMFKCLSINLYRHSNGSAACEMNNSTRELRPGSFIYKYGYEYDQITMLKMCDAHDGCKTEEGNSFGPIANWRLDGSDPDITLRGDAVYQTDSGRKVLYLDGTQSYAETPAVNLMTTSFTIACWIKISSPGTRDMTIYGDWSSPYQLRLHYRASGHRVAFQGRNTDGNDQLIVERGPIPLEQWVHLAVTWNRGSLKLKMFWNGNVVESNSARHSDVIDLMKTGHAVYDIGLKRDDGSASTFKGFLKELMIFNRRLNEDEVEAIKDMPPQMIPWKLKIYKEQKSSEE